MKKGDKKKQAKALAKRTERKAAQKATRATATEVGVRPIRQARKYPIEGCWTQKDWQKGGLAVIVVARRQPNALLVIGTYLVDYYCLGIKNAYARADVSPGEFHTNYLPKAIPGGVPVVITPALAHELIYGSVEYAAGFGFRPHRDFELAQEVLDLPGHHPRSGTVTFGKDGKPFYVSGPYDNVTAIMNTLMRTAGPDNFDYLAHIDDPLDELDAAFEATEDGEDQWPAE